jgi:hypothetical protein
LAPIVNDNVLSFANVVVVLCCSVDLVFICVPPPTVSFIILHAEPVQINDLPVFGSICEEAIWNDAVPVLLI